MNLLKIAADGQFLLARKKTGIGWYSYHMMKAMLEQQEIDFRLDYFVNPTSQIDTAALRDFQRAGCSFNGCPFGNAQLYKATSEFLPLRHRWFFGGGGISLYHFFNYFVPPHIGTHWAVTATIHDTAFAVYPESVPAKRRTLMALSLKNTCRRVDALVTVSEFSKQEIVKHLGVSPEKITVTYNGVDSSVFHPGYPDEELRRAKERRGITRDYFLYVGTLEPRKNLVRLLEAYALLKARRHDLPLLVLAGQKGWMYDEIFRRTAELGLSQDVVYTGYLTEREKPLLMGGALAFLFVSLYEGFGIPPLEAMACGTPTLVSDCSSLPEVAGDATLLADPKDIEAIAAQMELLLDQPELRVSLSEKGRKRAKEFTWEKSASVLLDLFRQLSGS